MASTGKTKEAKVVKAKPATIVLYGVPVGGDKFDRLRFLLLERKLDGRDDYSWRTLQYRLPEGRIVEQPRSSDEALTVRPAYTVPYKLHEPDSTDVRGEFTVTVPNRKTKYSTGDRAKYWRDFVAPLRGRELKVEAAIRGFSFVDAATGAQREGYALDLVDITIPEKEVKYKFSA